MKSENKSYITLHVERVDLLRRNFTHGLFLRMLKHSPENSQL